MAKRTGTYEVPVRPGMVGYHPADEAKPKQWRIEEMPEGYIEDEAKYALIARCPFCDEDSEIMGDDLEQIVADVRKWLVEHRNLNKETNNV